MFIRVSCDYSSLNFNFLRVMLIPNMMIEKRMVLKFSSRKTELLRFFEKVYPLKCLVRGNKRDATNTLFTDRHLFSVEKELLDRLTWLRYFQEKMKINSRLLHHLILLTRSQWTVRIKENAYHSHISNYQIKIKPSITISCILSIIGYFSKGHSQELTHFLFPLNMSLKHFF